MPDERAGVIAGKPSSDWYYSKLLTTSATPMMVQVISCGLAWREVDAVRAGAVWMICFLSRDLNAPIGGLGREVRQYALEFHADLKTLQILPGSVM